MLGRLVASQVKHNSYFLAGLALGLWAALAVVPLDEDVATCEPLATGATDDEWAPRVEARVPPAAPPPARPLQRPRYYTTELGMRGGVFAGVLSSEEELGGRAAALNATAARLLPALRFFMAASGPRPSVSPLPNVVGFTDPRRMLQPFRAIKYLADNYLEEYSFFFLATDETYVNARRLRELVAGLSVGADLYVGVPADDDAHYCSLESGVLLSNSVVRAVHGQLEWCVRNSYSAHHHENLGRCVLHAAHVRCAGGAHGRSYGAVRLRGGRGGLRPEDYEAVAGAVTAWPVRRPQDFYALQAGAARHALVRWGGEQRALRAAVWTRVARHPPGYRNGTWPAGLRHDPALDAPHPPPPPANRFEHLRWTWMNATHALLPDELRAVASLHPAHKSVVESACEWGEKRWGERVSPVEGAYRWEPPLGLRYRLLLRGGSGRSHLVEGMRPLGAARLVPVPYVTESARVTIVLPVLPDAAAAAAGGGGGGGGEQQDEALGFVRRYGAQRDSNTALLVVLLQTEGHRQQYNGSSLRAAVDSLRAARPALSIDIVDHRWDSQTAGGDVTVAALEAGAARLPDGALLLVVPPHLDYTEDFLNRVRMNTIPGEQWFLPVPFARYSQYSHPAFRQGEGGRRPQLHTGRFNPRHRSLLAVSRSDFMHALQRWRAAGGDGDGDGDAASVLSRSPLRCLHAPEPGAVLSPRPPPCPATPTTSCLRRQQFAALDLGARQELAKLLLETERALR